MREIIFRGKRVDNGEWAYGDLAFKKDGTPCIRFWTKLGIFTARAVIPETVGQYTGLTDKNGKKIFEGDIVEFDDEVWESYYTSCGDEYDSWEVKNCGVVGFDEDRSCFDFINYKFNENSVEADLHENHDIEFAEFISELVVIGNIHDTPELLEKEADNGKL